jgi:hypothetical protein
LLRAVMAAMAALAAALSAAQIVEGAAGHRSGARRIDLTLVASY